MDNAELRPELVSLMKSKEEKWNWRSRAEDVGMQDDYNFIYRYTCTFLHAVPSSLSTDMKNLEMDEVAIFLKYINVRLVDIIEMAETLLGSSPTSNSNI